MWKMQFSMRSIGRSIFRHFRSACFLFCFSLLVINSGMSQTVTNVDFCIVSGLQDIPGSDGVPDLSIWNKYPTGRILFWTVLFDENQERGSFYRSESGHIGFMQVIDGTEYFLIADSNGSPCRWLLEPHSISGSDTYMGETRSVSSYVPAVWSKTYFDIFGTQGNNVLGRLFKNGEGIIETSTREGVVLSDAVGSCSFKWRKYSMGTSDYYGIVPGIWGEAVNWGQWGPWWYQGCNHYYSLRAVWRANYFDVDLEFFRGLLDSQWWLTGKYAVHWNDGITGIGHGSGEQGMSGSPAPSGGGITSVPGDDILNPPTTPLGQNGKWVYDPEKKVWQWQGDIADNVDKINPYDNSVMPENSLSTEGKWATESTLRRVLQTLEGFQKQQGITPEQLQAMIDSGVVSIVDGMVQYWEGQNLVGAINDHELGVAGRLSAEGTGIKNAINQHKQVSAAISSRVSGLEVGVARVNTSIGAVNASIGEAKTDIVNAISELTIPENPTVDGQETESYEITAPDLSQIDGWFTFDFPRLTIARTFVFEDYEVGVFGWKIPFSALNDSYLRVMINTVRNILAWLVYLSAVLGVFKAMGGGV